MKNSKDGYNIESEYQSNIYLPLSKENVKQVFEQIYKTAVPERVLKLQYVHENAFKEFCKVFQEECEKLSKNLENDKQ